MRLDTTLSVYKNAFLLHRRSAIAVEKNGIARRFNALRNTSLRKISSALSALLFLSVPFLNPRLASATTSCPPAAPVSDNFTGSSLNTAVWTVVAPAGGSASVNNGQAVLSVPGGSNHDPSAGGVNNSVRLLQTVSNSNFDVTVKFNSAVSLSQYDGQGILVQQDASDYITFGMYSDGYSRYLNAVSIAGGTSTNRVSMWMANAASPYWIQVVRSGNSWTLSGSTDGTNYTTVGSFTLAMTVAQVGPFAWNYNSNPASAPAVNASIDYFYNLPSAGTTSSSTCAPGAPVSDNFTGSSLNTALWTVAAPAGGSASAANGQALLSVPGGSNHDPSAGGANNSVRIMQTISNSNFDVAVKFNSAVSLSQYDGQGILVQQDASDYITFGIYSDGYSRYLNAVSIAGGTPTNHANMSLPNAGAPYWIQVLRSGNTWTLSGSTDGTNYTTVGSFNLAMTVAQIGPFAWNYNSNPSSSPAVAASIGAFDNLATTSGSGPGGPTPPPAGSPAVSLSPTSISFGSVNVGSTSASETVTLSSTGTADLTIDSISITGSNSSDFSQTNTCGTSLNTGSDCTITITFSPAAAGSLSATLSVATNSSGSPASVSLSGTGESVTNTPPPTGTGGITYGVADNVYPADQTLYNVKNYGAKGDGVTDDTAAIEAAMAANWAGIGQPNHGASRTGLYFPAGTYLISKPIMAMTQPANPAVVTATISNPGPNGCISGFTVVYPGSGYQNSYSINGSGTAAGLWITGGGGSGANNQWADLSGGSVIDINMAGVSCIGHGYTSAPNVQVVNWQNTFIIQGQNKSNTTIKFIDNSPYFSNHNCNASFDENQPRENCTPVIAFSSGCANADFGASESAYENELWNITIDTGKGNPGAVAVKWIGSNVASIRNVNIISEDGQGRAGLDMSQNNIYGAAGPDIVKNVSIQGFDLGINMNIDTHEVGTTFEYIDLEHQNVAGVVTAGWNNYFREVSSTNSVPVFVKCYYTATPLAPYYCGTGGSGLTVIDGTFVGGSPLTSAILAQDTGQGGVMFFRNITTNGYASALATGQGNTIMPGSSITEYAYPAPQSQFSPSTLTSLNLSVPPVPDFADGNFADWADVSAYGAACQPNSWQDPDACINAAMASGKPVIYFPAGQYNISSTIHIPSTVRKIIGSHSYLYAAPSRVMPFQNDSTSGSPVIIEGFDLDDSSEQGIIQNGASPLVLRDILMGGAALTNTSSGTGDIYIDDCAMASATLHLVSSQHFYAHQLDIEDGYSSHLTVTGGTSWIFGYKTEGPGNLISATDATLEVLGQFSTANPAAGTAITYLMNNSNFSLSDVTIAEGWPDGVVQETRGSTTMTLGENGKWWAGVGLGLYSGHN